jgi:hypothetical protein
MPGQQQPVTNPRLVKLIELEAAGRIKPEHQAELDSYRARGVIATPKALTEGEAKTTNFYNSALAAENEWKGLEADPTTASGTQPVGMGGDVARKMLPANVVNSNTSTGRQRAQQAKENFIRASLRLESGAAIGSEEYNRQDRIFYPQTGDAPETLAQKARARQAVIEGFKIGSGPGARQVDQLRHDDAGKVVEPLSVDNVTDYALGLRDKKPGPPQQQADGSIAVRMPDGTMNTYPTRADYEQGSAEDEIAAPFGGDKNSEGYRAAYKARFGKEAPLVVDVVGGQPARKPVDAGDGAVGAFARGAGDTSPPAWAAARPRTTSRRLGSSRRCRRCRRLRARWCSARKGQTQSTIS